MKAKWMGAVGVSMVLASCGSDEADSGGGDAGLGGGGAPSGGSPGTGGTPGGGDFPAFGYTPAGSPCGLPVGSRYLAELRPTAADGYSEPVSWLISGEDGVVLGRGGETCRFPRSGGEIQPSTSPGGRVWLAASDALLVGTAGGLVLKVPAVGDTWREAAVFPLPPSYGPDSPFDGRLALSVDRTRVAYRISPLGLGTHTYGVLEAGQAQARTLAGDVAVGSFAPVVVDGTHLWSAAGPINEESPVRVPLQGGAPEVRSDVQGVPVGIDADWLYFVRASSERIEELGFWRSPLAGGPPERLNDDFTVFDGFGRGQDHTAAWSPGAIYTLAPTGLTEVASIPVRSALDASCSGHGFSVYAGQVFSTIYDEARGGSLLYAVVLP